VYVYTPDTHSRNLYEKPAQLTRDLHKFNINKQMNKKFFEFASKFDANLR